ncbi:hypothetical protein Tco_1437084 [Tanacetum coccineum]
MEEVSFGFQGGDEGREVAVILELKGVTRIVRLGKQGYAVKGFAAVLSVLKPERLKVDKARISLSYPSTNKAFQVPEDSPCLKPFLYGKHELLASVDIFPCPKLCIQTRIHPVDLEFLDPVVQCLINLLQSVVTELVDLIKAHDHLNPIFIPKCDGPWRVNYCEIVLELKASGIPSRFSEV